MVAAASTDSSGRFAFAEVPSGAIEVYAFRQSTYEQARATSSLAPNGAVDLSLAFPGIGGTVRGIVVDALGNALAQAPVAGGPTLTETDALGEFIIENMPLGTFTQALGPGGTRPKRVRLQEVNASRVTKLLVDPRRFAAGQARLRRCGWHRESSVTARSSVQSARAFKLNHCIA